MDIKNDKKNKTAAALGIFDGLHLGHLKVLEAAKRTAASSGLVPAVFTFDTRSVTTKSGGALMTDADKRSFLAKQGFSFVCSADFAELKDLSPREFIRQVLIEKMNVGCAVCGEDFRFGKGAAADSGDLKRLCAGYGIEAHEVSRLKIDGEEVSSTHIRALISGGGIARANALLGYSYGYSLPVIHGFARGRTWNFPTINQLIPEGLVLPRFGVYCSLVTVGEKKYAGVTNIGVKPTVENGSPPLAETFIIDFSGDLYGTTVDLRLCEFVRPEQTFGSFDELRTAIARDTGFAKRYFEQRSSDL